MIMKKWKFLAWTDEYDEDVHADSNEKIF